MTHGAGTLGVFLIYVGKVRCCSFSRARGTKPQTWAKYVDAVTTVLSEATQAARTRCLGTPAANQAALQAAAMQGGNNVGTNVFTIDQDKHRARVLFARLGVLLGSYQKKLLSQAMVLLLIHVFHPSALRACCSTLMLASSCRPCACTRKALPRTSLSMRSPANSSTKNVMPRPMATTSPSSRTRRTRSTPRGGNSCRTCGMRSPRSPFTPSRSRSASATKRRTSFSL
jgi:hypothetical protein